MVTNDADGTTALIVYSTVAPSYKGLGKVHSEARVDPSRAAVARKLSRVTVQKHE